MKNSRYWAKRKLERMDEYHKDNDKVIGKVLEAYQDSIKEINEQMAKILKTYSATSGMAAEEALKYLTIGESKEFIENLKKTINYITDEKLRAEMLRQINAPAYRARLTRLQAMKEKLNVECKKLADIQVRDIEKGLISTANTAYYRTMFDIQKRLGVGFSFAEIPTRQIEEILKNNWSGKHFSKRIWSNTDKLASELEHTLTKGFMTGASIQRMSKDIATKMEVGEYAATRLIRTETTYVANSAELEAYKEAEVEKIMYLATLDLRTSDICREHDHKIIPLSEAVSGENIPPLHANCRSTTIEIFDDDNLKAIKRRSRDPETGVNDTVSANMSYEDWYKKYVKDKVDNGFDNNNKDLKILDKTLEHANEGEFTNPKNPNKVKPNEIRLKSGGHGEENVTLLQKKGLEYNIVKEYPNGVRIGNVSNHKAKEKRTGTAQAWFPKNWTSKDIKKAAEYVANLKNKDKYFLKRNYDESGNLISIFKFSRFKEVTVGICYDVKAKKITTIFPDETQRMKGGE